MSVVRQLGTVFALFVVVTGMRSLSAQQQSAPPKTPEAEEASKSSSPFGWLKMPTVTMPKLTMPKITMPKMPADPLAPFKTSAKKVGDGTKKAWEGTKEMFAIGRGKPEEPAARVASQGEPPTLMQRMFGAKEEPKEEGPRTIGEWMSQPRIDP
jgi:hypothetical protein